MRITAVQQIQNLVFEDVPQAGIPLSSNISISTNEEERTAIASDPNMAAGFGTLYTAMIANSKAIALTREEYSSSAYDALTVFPRVFISRVVHFFIALWLIKDNSGNGSPVCTYLIEDGKAAGSIQGHDSMCLTAACTVEEVTFARSELDDALRYYQQIDQLIPKIKADLHAPSATGVTDESRISRTLFLVQAARNAGDVGLKSAFYCICFECLFSTADAELSHRVSERTACFIGGTGSDRRAIYQDIRTLYGIRSPVVHGGSIDASKVPAYIEVLKRCDGHLRRCLRRILDSPQMLVLFAATDPAVLTTYFLNELFPDHFPQPATE